MGIFDDKVQVFARYAVTIKFRDKIMGGVPKDAKIIESWLRAKAGIEQKEELRRAMLQTILDNGGDVNDEMTYEEISDAAAKLSLHRQTNGFKRDNEVGLYLESRAVKAGFKESTNVLFAGSQWGPTRKGPRNFVAERVFVSPDKISLGVQEPTGIELFIGHTSGPSGPQSNLTHIEYVTQPTIKFVVMVARDGVEDNHWPEIFVHMQENGLGALRSQGFGRFDVLQFDRLNSVPRKAAEQVATVARKNGRATKTTDAELDATPALA
jgi:hypothetical protein